MSHKPLQSIVILTRIRPIHSICKSNGCVRCVAWCARRLTVSNLFFVLEKRTFIDNTNLFSVIMRKHKNYVWQPLVPFDLTLFPIFPINSAQLFCDFGGVHRLLIFNATTINFYVYLMTIIILIYSSLIFTTRIYMLSNDTNSFAGWNNVLRPSKLAYPEFACDSKSGTCK